MKWYWKMLIIFAGCGLSGVLTWGTTQLTDWSTVFGGLQIAVIASVGILTGFKASS